VKWTQQAQYREPELPEYAGNPLVLALPPLRTDREIVELLTIDWMVPREEERSAPAYLREAMLERLSQFQFPLPETFRAFRNIERAITSGYLARNPMTPTGQYYLHYPSPDATEAQPRTGPFRPTGRALSLFGASGAGKSWGVDRVLSAFPQVIHHTTFNGRPANFDQLVWLKVDCPSKSTLWGFARKIVAALNKLVVKDEESFTAGNPRNLPDMEQKIVRMLKSRFLGLLSLEELQNLEVGTDERRKELQNFFLTIINDSGIPILFIGNEDSVAVLQDTLRNARRAEAGGCVLQNTIDKRVWPSFVDRLWQYQYTRVSTPLDKDLSASLYRLSSGLPDFAVRIFEEAQRSVIGSNDETLRKDVLEKAALRATIISGLATTSFVEPSAGHTRDEGKKAEEESEVDKRLKNKSGPKPGAVSSNQILHPEFEDRIRLVRKNGYACPDGVDADVLRRSENEPDIAEFLRDQGIAVADAHDFVLSLGNCK